MKARSVSQRANRAGNSKPIEHLSSQAYKWGIVAGDESAVSSAASSAFQTRPEAEAI